MQGVSLHPNRVKVQLAVHPSVEGQLDLRERHRRGQPHRDGCRQRSGDPPVCAVDALGRRHPTTGRARDYRSALATDHVGYLAIGAASVPKKLSGCRKLGSSSMVPRVCVVHADDEGVIAKQLLLDRPDCRVRGLESDRGHAVPDSVGRSGASSLAHGGAGPHHALRTVDHV